MIQWDSYFTTIAEASATLTGLIFIGLSLNLQKILASKQLPARALGSLILMAYILLISSFCLIPQQSIFMLGVEALTSSIIVWVNITRMDILMHNEAVKKYKRHYFQNLIFSQLALLPYLVAGVFLVSGSANGFYWLIPGITISIIKALTDSWVLLVEINR